MSRFASLLILLPAAVALLTACGSSHHLAAATPMRNVLVYGKYPNVGPTGDAGTGRIWVAAQNGEDRRFLTIGDSPAVSPDGRYVAYVRRRRVLVIPTAGGKPRDVGRGDWDLTWAPNSRFLAFARFLRVGSGEAFVVNGKTGKQMATIHAFTDSLAFSPNSQRIAYTTAEHSDLYVASARGGSPVRLANDHRSDGVAWGRPGIAFFRFTNSGGDIWLTDGRPHHARRLTHGGGGSLLLLPLSFSADGRELLASGVSGHTATVWAVDVPSGDVRQFPYSRVGAYAVPLGLSTDGTTVLAAAASDYESTYFWLETFPFAGGKAHIVAHGVDSTPFASWNVR